MYNIHATIKIMSTRELCTNKDQIRSVISRGVEHVLPEVETLVELMSKQRIRVYLGIDPTGSELTLGHSVVLRKLQQIADLGHEVILLIGNGTVKIGDPTGRDSSRPELDDATIEANFAHWQEQANKVLDFSTIEIKKNGDWLDTMQFSDIIKLLATTTVQQLLERDMFQKRLQNNLPIYSHEILYPLIQGYDSVVMDIDLEIGGTDQLFNMLMGRTLQKQLRNKEKWVLTTPIINGSDGRKMSKSFGNYIGLTEPAEDMYGKIMSIVDEEIIPYFTNLTDVPLERVTEIQHQMAEGTNPIEYKKELARTIVSMYHDETAASEAEARFERVVQKKLAPDQIPSILLTDQNLSIIDIVGICQPNLSKGERRRLIEQGGVKLDDEKIIDPLIVLPIANGQIIKIGKRGYYSLLVQE